MHYQISRNGQQYGPYTLEDLKRYLATGNVQPTDLVKNEDMPEWIPVSQLLAAEPQTAQPQPQSQFQPQAQSAPFEPTPAYSQPAPSVMVDQYPDPPNLNWGLVLLFDLVTCSLFQYVWNLIVAAWTRRVQPNSTALFYYIGADLLYLVYMAVTFVTGFSSAIFMARSGVVYHHSSGEYAMRGFIGLAFWVLKLIARFQHRESLLEHFNGPEPIGLRLSGVMTFFFGGLYFQYHLNRINALKAAARFGAPRY
ncbi:DUF4339 domain-containing protein [Granulicella sp. WH15]|uniref:DUF4339 domain-containing protein n=1 Tax=Granulicella sp. WH15 TaxID=2602070 RepID=UPI001366F4A8|nr:DUF4339 domain-containing protein [Granulicella sp. WH15]QHN04680.1 DUF4339 domain-containing protein [Granulicella sp. WH15]